MKIGKIQKLENVTLTSTVLNVTGFAETNIIDPNTLNLWKVEEGDVTLTIEHDSITADVICLFNVDLETSVQIKTYSAYPGTVIETKTILAAELITSLESKNALFELTDTSTSIVAIDLVFSGPTSTYETFTGFIWVGEIVNFGCSEAMQEAMQPTDNSNDNVNITRANVSDSKEEYSFQNYDLTLKKENDFLTLRTNMRSILESGYGLPRPYIIDEPYFADPEVIYGILDSGKVAYDLFFTSKTAGTYIAQVTLGIRETF
jgi:hypothetical protein